MIRRPPRSTRTDTLFPYTTLFRSVLAMVARFMPAKGHDVALRALATIQQKEWTLVLAGSLETPYAREMQALAHQLGIADRIRFIGHRDDVHNIYGSADIQIGRAHV